MLFDSLLGLAERGYLPQDVKQIVNASRLFVFPGRAHEVLPGEKVATTDEEVADLNVHFRMPFDRVAVEDSASLVVIADTEDEQSGLSGTRRFVEFEALGSGRDEEFSGGPIDVPIEIRAQFHNTFSVVWGSIENLVFDPKRFGGNHMNAGFRYGGHGCFEKKKGRRDDLAHFFDRQHVMANAANNVLTAMSELNAFNQPNRWILEESPLKAPRGGKTKREPRSHERPIYTLLKPDQIRERFGLPALGDPEATSPRPHERRGHWRTYRHERFYASGLLSRRRWVRATWVGPSEVVVGKRRYRVCLDL